MPFRQHKAHPQVAYHYLLHIDTDYDPPEVSIEVFEDFAAHERARKAEAARVRKATKEAKCAAEAKAKADREATEAERQADIAELERLTAAAERQVAAVAALRMPSSMVDYQDSRNAYYGAERMLHAAVAFARTKGIEEPSILRSLTAKLGPCKVRLGA